MCVHDGKRFAHLSLSSLSLSLRDTCSGVHILSLSLVLTFSLSPSLPPSLLPSFLPSLPQSLPPSRQSGPGQVQQRGNLPLTSTLVSYIHTYTSETHCWCSRWQWRSTASAVAQQLRRGQQLQRLRISCGECISGSS